MGYNVKRTQNSRVQEIADNLGLPYTTVNSVINEYISSLQSSIMKGEDAGVHGLFSIKLCKAQDGKVLLRGAVSNVLRQRVAEQFNASKKE